MHATCDAAGGGDANTRRAAESGGGIVGACIVKPSVIAAKMTKRHNLKLLTAVGAVDDACILPHRADEAEACMRPLTLIIRECRERLQAYGFGLIGWAHCEATDRPKEAWVVQVANPNFGSEYAYRR